jgi:hypothetical protein
MAEQTTPAPPPAAGAPKIRRMMLTSADGKKEHVALANGMIIPADVAKGPWNVRFDTDPATIGSVRAQVQRQKAPGGDWAEVTSADSRLEKTRDYTLFETPKGGTLPPGEYKIIGIPYPDAEGKAAGAMKYTVTVKVPVQPAAPAPVPAPPPKPAPTVPIPAPPGPFKVPVQAGGASIGIQLTGTPKDLDKLTGEVKIFDPATSIFPGLIPKQDVGLLIYIPADLDKHKGPWRAEFYRPVGRTPEEMPKPLTLYIHEPEGTTAAAMLKLMNVEIELPPTGGGPVSIDVTKIVRELEQAELQGETLALVHKVPAARAIVNRIKAARAELRSLIAGLVQSGDEVIS